jgi:hypothetical protein
LDGRPPLEIKEFGIFLTFARFSPIAGSPRGFGVWPKIGWASLHQNARVDIRPHRQVMVDFMTSSSRKTMASITMLISWSVWKERNARAFNNKSVPPSILLVPLKTELRLWVAEGEKYLGHVILGE